MNTTNARIALALVTALGIFASLPAAAGVIVPAKFANPPAAAPAPHVVGAHFVEGMVTAIGRDTIAVGAETYFLNGLGDLGGITSGDTVRLTFVLQNGKRVTFGVDELGADSADEAQ